MTVMKDDILFLVYNKCSKIKRERHVMKVGEKEHHISFELSWIKLASLKNFKDDYYLSRIKEATNIDELLLITDNQLN